MSSLAAVWRALALPFFIRVRVGHTRQVSLCCKEALGPGIHNNKRFFPLCFLYFCGLEVYASDSVLLDILKGVGKTERILLLVLTTLLQGKNLIFNAEYKYLK